MARFKVEVRHSGNTPNWTDITEYVKPEWDTELTTETSLGNITTGNITFRVIDRDTDQDTHHWFETLASSTTDPEVKLSALLADGATYQTIFWGRVEQSLYTYENDCVSSFTACTLRGYANKLDMHYANGQAVTGQYSGPAATILETALRKAGFTAGSVSDVVIHDWFRGDDENDPVQTDQDWNHVKRYWSNTDLTSGDTRNGSLDDSTSGDVLPAPQGQTGAKAFTIWHGRLCRIKSENGYDVMEEVLDNSGDPYTTTGHRLGRFIGPGGIECICIFEVEERHSYTRQSITDKGWSGVATGVAIASGIAAMAIPGLQWWGIVAIGLGGTAASYGIDAAATRNNDLANADRFYALTGGRVLSVGDGTNGGAEGVGIAFNQPFTAFHNLKYHYTAGDSCCTSVQSWAGGEYSDIWIAETNELDQTVWVSRTSWVKGDNAWLPWNRVLRKFWTDAGGKPCGGMAVKQSCGYCGGVDGGFTFHPLSSGVYDAKPVTGLDRPAARQIAPMEFSVEGAGYYMAFIVGNGTGKAIEQKFLEVNGYAPDSMSVPVLADISGLPQHAVILSTNAQPIGYEGYDKTSCIYEVADSNGRKNYYVGVLYTGQDRGPTYDSSYMDKPIPALGGDWRPPVMYQDGSQNGAWRFLAINSYADREYIVTDLYSTSCYDLFCIHWDFNRDRLSIGQLLDDACRSGWCYLRLNSPDACNDGDDVRIISRHVWMSPGYNPSAGTLAKLNVAAQPRVVGSEYYDGAVAETGGVRVEAGSVGVGKTVLNFSGLWLTPARARLIAEAVVDQYPRRSTSYPYGRRIFAPDVITLTDTSNDLVPPSQADIYKMVRVSFLTGLSTTALVTGVGLNRSSLLYPCRMLEWADGSGATWTQDSPEELVMLPSYPQPRQRHTGPPVAIADIKSFYSANDTTALDSTSRMNPDNSPCAYAYRIKPAAGYMAGIRYKLVLTATVNDAGWIASLFTDDNGKPGVAIDGTEVRKTAHSGGPIAVEVGLWDGAAEDPDMRTALFGAACWMVVVVDRDDLAGVVPPKIAWLNFGVPGCAYRLSYQDAGLGLDLVPLESWDDTYTEDTQYTPDIQVMLAD